MLVRPSDLPAAFIEPCLPSSAPTPPSGEVWLHEIKWDGFRVIARKDGARVKLYSRPGNDLTDRFPLIVEGMGKLRLHSCIIDGEAVACRADGMPCFELIRRWERNEGVFMWAFELIELDRQDMRREPLERRKATLEGMLSQAAPAICFNEHITGDGEIVFQRACELGLEGIVSKRKDSRYISGRTLHWIKSKNPNAPAVKREAEEDWGKWPTRDRRSSR